MGFEFINDGYVNKKECGESIIEFFYPFECFSISKNMPIETVFYPEKLEKNMYIQFNLDMSSSKGFILTNKSANKIDLYILPEIITYPDIQGFNFLFFKTIDYPSLEIKDLGYYSATLNTIFSQPTTITRLNYEISIVRSPIRIWLPIICSILIPYIMYLGRKHGRQNKKAYYIMVLPAFILSFAITYNFGAMPEEILQLKSIPLILMITSIVIILLKEFYNELQTYLNH